MSETSELSRQLEDYLEAIYHLETEKRVARVSDIAESLGVQPPTVTGALKHLAQHKLINYEPYQPITLTPAGSRIARNTIRRHETLRTFMADVLGLPASTADQDACGMEHALSEQAHERLVLFLKFLAFNESQPTGRRDLIDAFRTFCRNDNDAQPTAKGTTESADSQRRGGR